MGIALYRRPRDGALFAIVGGKSGPDDFGWLRQLLEWQRETGLSVDDELSYLREFEHVSLARLLSFAGLAPEISTSASLMRSQLPFSRS